MVFFYIEKSLVSVSIVLCFLNGELPMYMWHVFVKSTAILSPSIPSLFPDTFPSQLLLPFLTYQVYLEESVCAWMYNHPLKHGQPLQGHFPEEN